MDRIRFKKVHWKENKTSTFSYYCPSCSVLRRVPLSPCFGRPIHFVQVGVTTLLSMALTWRWFAFKGAVIFFPLWIIFEVVYRMRVRASLVCRRCGFDPSLYLVDNQRAREAVRNHWEKANIEHKSDTPASPLDSDTLKS